MSGAELNAGQPATAELDGREVELVPDDHGNTYVDFGDGTAALHVEPGSSWVYVTDTTETEVHSERT